MTRFDNFIDGAWLAGATTRPNINPSDTRDVIGEYAQADAAQAGQAIAAASAAAPGWGHRATFCELAHARDDFFDARRAVPGRA